MVRISKYWKTVIGALAPVLVTVQSAVDDGKVDTSEGITIGLALLVAFGVWRVPNKVDLDDPAVRRYIP